MASKSSSHGHKFVTEPDDDLTCRICLEVATDPWQHGKCGKLFCKGCLEKYGRQKACPHCRERQPQYFEDNHGSKEKIRALHVRCDNVERGCKWEGTIGTLDDHVTEVCQFTPVPCPNVCGDDNIMKKDLEEHLKSKCLHRVYKCEYCGEEGTYVSINKEHDKICKKIVPCTNTGCDMTMERGKVEAHVANDCEYTEISCKYESIGCDVKMKRRNIRDHEEEDDKVHLHKALDTIMRIKILVPKINMISMKDTVTFKITNYQERKDNNETFMSPSFYTSPTGYHMCIGVDLNGSASLDGTIDGSGSHVSVYARILEGWYDKDLKWPFVGIISVEILNQLANENHVKEIHTNPERCFFVNCRQGYPKFISHSELSEQYLKDNTLYFRVSFKVFNDKPWLDCTVE